MKSIYQPVLVLSLCSALAFAGCNESDDPKNAKKPSGSTQTAAPPNSALKPPPYSYVQDVLSIPSLPLNDVYFGTTGVWSSTYKDIWGFDDLNPTTEFASLILPAQEVVVAIVDTGLDYDAPDLAGRMWRNPGESGGGRESNGVDDDGNGYVDDFIGWNWVHNNNHPVDDNGHGTHVAGTIAAVGGNALGIVGVAPWVRIMPLKVCHYGGSCGSSDVRAGIRYAIENGAKVVNISLGGPVAAADMAAYESVIADAEAAGVVVVVSAGNSSANVMSSVPANITYAMAVSASASDGLICSSFSNYGFKIEVSAPGCGFDGVSEVNGILSLNSRKCGSNGDAFCSTRTASDPNYSLKRGTSMSAPHVSGLAALAFTASPTASASMVRQAIRRSAQLASVMSTGEKHIDHGFGRASALSIASEAQTSPGVKITSPRFDASAATHNIGFRIEARAHDVTYEFSYLSYSGTESVNLTGGTAFGTPGVVLAGQSANLTETFTGPSAGTFAVILTATSNGQTYRDLIFLKKP